MADPGDTAALCNDTKSHIPYEPGQPADPDIEAGPVIGEEPTTQGVVGEELEEEVGEGEEGEEGTTDAADAGEPAKKVESKIPFIYNIVEPGCTALSCYSAIITFIVMSCGVFWLLLISPPLNAKAYETRLPWENKMNHGVNASLAADEQEGTLDPDAILEELGSGGGTPDAAALVGGLEVEEGGGGNGGKGGGGLVATTGALRSGSTYAAAAAASALPTNQT